MPNNSQYLSDLFYRSFELDRATVDPDKRTVALAFSSETPVERWFGKEILLHGQKNVDLTRLRAMGSALMNHNPSEIVGRITSPKIIDKRGHATLVFDDDDDGNRAMNKVVSGSLKGVSVGYLVETFRNVERDETYNGIEGPAYIATRWVPYEISLTPIPADASVGVGRAMTRSLDGITIEPLDRAQEDDDMKRDEVLQLIREELPGLFRDEMTGAVTDIVNTVMTDQNKPKIRVTPEELNDLSGKAAAISPEAKVRVLDMVNEGRTAVEISNELLALATNPDAKNRGQGGDGRNDKEPAGTGRDPRTPITSFDQVDDDMFVRGLSKPNQFVH